MQAMQIRLRLGQIPLKLLILRIGRQLGLQIPHRLVLLSVSAERHSLVPLIRGFSGRLGEEIDLRLGARRVQSGRLPRP